VNIYRINPQSLSGKLISFSLIFMVGCVGVASKNFFLNSIVRYTTWVDPGIFSSGGPDLSIYIFRHMLRAASLSSYGVQIEACFFWKF
jgi:hypothetical protein